MASTSTSRSSLVNRTVTTGLTPSSSPVPAAATVSRLVGVIVVLSLFAALMGLFWQGGEGPSTATTVTGDTVDLYSIGLYRHDSLLKAGANRGSDVLTLALGIPLLLTATLLYRRGSFRGGLMLLGTLSYFLYLYATLSIGTAYNHLFLVYVALCSAGLFAFIVLFVALAGHDLALRFPAGMPRRGPGIFMLVSGVVTFVVWMMAPFPALLRGEIPALVENNTTLVTHALDLAIIVPAAVIAGLLILGRKPLGYLVAMSLLVLEALLAPMIALQTIFQLAAGVEFTTVEIIGPIGGFIAIALAALWFIVAILRGTVDAPT